MTVHVWSQLVWAVGEGLFAQFEQNPLHAGSAIRHRAPQKQREFGTGAHY